MDEFRPSETRAPLREGSPINSSYSIDHNALCPAIADFRRIPDASLPHCATVGGTARLLRSRRRVLALYTGASGT